MSECVCVLCVLCVSLEVRNSLRISTLVCLALAVRSEGFFVYCVFCIKPLLGVPVTLFVFSDITSLYLGLVAKKKLEDRLSLGCDEQETEFDRCFIVVGQSAKI